MLRILVLLLHSPQSTANPIPATDVKPLTFSNRETEIANSTTIRRSARGRRGTQRRVAVVYRPRGHGRRRHSQ